MEDSAREYVSVRNGTRSYIENRMKQLYLDSYKAMYIRKGKIPFEFTRSKRQK